MWHFARGYVILQIKGISIARFLKRLTENGIPVEQIKRIDPATVRFQMPANRFFELRRLRKGLPLRIRIVGRSGLPFVLKKLICRPVLWIGTLVLFAGLCWASARIWAIRIEGAERVEPAEVLALMKEHGLFIGARPKGPVLMTAANDLSARIYDAAWIGLDREGIVLTVNVVESKPASVKKTGVVPSDVIAEKDGVVTEMQVMRGQARVKVGDTVHAGDVLISGTVTYQTASYQTDADGVVKAAVLYEAEYPVCDTVEELVETDRTEPVRMLRIGPWTILRQCPSFERYRLLDTRTIETSDRFPAYIDETLARELVLQTRALSESEAEELALSRAAELAIKRVPKDAAIINQYGTIRRKDGDLIAVVTVTAEEIIGRTEEDPHGG